MRSIVVFAEDYGHEEVLGALIRRVAADLKLPVQVRALSTRGGHGPMLKELSAYASELRAGSSPLPDMLVVARDANCKGLAARQKEIRKSATDYSGALVLAVPNPHIERWLLLDSHAFKTVLGQGCKSPDFKCDRDRYKQILDQAVRDTGIEPILGGLEFAADIVRAMDLSRMRKTPDLGQTIQDLHAQMRQWVE